MEGEGGRKEPNAVSRSLVSIKPNYRRRINYLVCLQLLTWREKCIFIKEKIGEKNERERETERER